MRVHTAGWLLLLVLSLTVVSGAAVRAEEKKNEKPKKEVKDMTAAELEEAGRCPVCRNESKQVYHFTVAEKTYHFASRKCQKEFGADPAKFGVKPDPKKDEPKKTEKPPAREEQKTEDENPGMMGQ